ncbi:hypothetical protein THRCLA_00182 [Thraustotheca clavata]|uniref:Uncharacterized protein n=1 Tax=Thraustotheca clavata TaxID=74557 RepID=A0A1W0AC10_9STRA|nr:hypothetical protein THRCLA_00182 [Thraustotheca clavata]
MERTRRGGRKPKNASKENIDMENASTSSGHGIRSPPPRLRGKKDEDRDDSTNVDDSMSEDDSDEKETTTQTLLHALSNYIEEADADILDEQKHGRKRRNNDEEDEDDMIIPTAAEFKMHMMELNKKVQMIEDSNFAEYCRRCTEFKDERTLALQTAQRHLELQLQNVETLTLFDLQKAKDLYENGKQRVQQDMAAHVQRMLDQVGHQLDTLDDNEPVFKKTKLDLSILSLKEVRLSPEETHQDIQSIGNQYKTIAIDIESLDKVITECNQGILSCGKYLFDEGDEIILSSNMMDREYIGTIQSFTKDALYVLLNTGENARVRYELLRQKRAEIKPFLRGNSAIKSLQATGWARCDPF